VQTTTRPRRIEWKKNPSTKRSPPSPCWCDASRPFVLFSLFFLLLLLSLRERVVFSFPVVSGKRRQPFSFLTTTMMMTFVSSSSSSLRARTRCADADRSLFLSLFISLSKIARAFKTKINKNNRRRRRSCLARASSSLSSFKDSTGRIYNRRERLCASG